MEIGFENRVVSTYREISRQTKRIQETAESVVPDTNDDIGKIASVQTAVLMKSKDVTSRGVLVTGELTAALIYITESEKSVSYVRLSKSFTLEYDIGEADADALAQVALTIQNSEARVLNPRKVSVTFELVGEMSCYRQENIVVDTRLPESAPEGLHARFESTELTAPNAVMEKTFAINEQFTFPGGKPKPSQLVTQCVSFAMGETQLIGTKVIVKGTVNITLCYLSNEVNYPVRAEFSTPFSQIIDTGEEQMEHCSAVIELTSCYCDIIDTINGEKALDAEIHAVLQLVCHSRQSVSYISDVYSNLMPAEFTAQTRQLGTSSAMQQVKLAADERVNVVYLRPDGPNIDAHICVEVSYQLSSTVEISRVEAVTLDDENPFDLSALPAVTLVRVESETLWELAKRYHSSEECIKASNPPEDAENGRLMLIPKTV